MGVNRIRNVRLFDGFACSQRFCRGKNRILNRGIACATTERIFQCKADLITCRIWIPFKQCISGHDLPGDAESALYRAVFDEGFLKRVESPSPYGRGVRGEGCKSFNCHNRLPIRSLGRIHTREDRLTIHEDSTRAALRLLASNLRACQAQSLAEESREGLTWDGREGMELSVYCKGDLCIHK